MIFIHRPEVYKKNPDPEERGIAEIIVAKQRNGPTGKFNLVFIKEYVRFENLEESEIAKKQVETEEETENISFEEPDEFSFDF